MNIQTDIAIAARAIDSAVDDLTQLLVKIDSQKTLTLLDTMAALTRGQLEKLREVNHEILCAKNRIEKRGRRATEARRLRRAQFEDS